jgi:hypothetical protein
MVMITLITRQKQKQWKTAAASFVLLFGLAQCTAVAEVPASAGIVDVVSTPAKAGATAEAVDANGVLMVHNVWVDTPLTQVFRDISMETGVAIVTCPHVDDLLISLDAGGSGKPLQECLQELVAGRGLIIYPKNKRFYLISCGDPKCPSFLEIAIPQRLYLKYITAKHFRSCLPPSVQQYVSSGERPNEVLVYAIPKIMEYIMGIVAELDTPSQQVVLEVLVVELCEEAGKEFGLDWKSDNQHVSVSMSHGLGIFEGIAKYTSVPADEFTSLLFTLKLLVSEGKAGIRSRPRVATLNGEKASIDMSLDEYYSIVTDLGSYDGALRTELQVIKSGVRLEITPHIGDNNDITVNVITEVSDVASRQNQVTGNMSGGSLPVIRRRKVDTCVRVKEGDAIVIGGLIETQEQNNVEKVPILGDIPLVGGLFHSTKSDTMEKEVMIFITPRLMKEGKDVFSDRHKLIDAEEELDALREAAAMPDTDEF